jgi:hypothetical protein
VKEIREKVVKVGERKKKKRTMRKVVKRREKK